MIDRMDRESILTLADCNMRVAAMAKKFGMSRKSMYYRLERVEEHTGLNPQNFYELRKLVDMVKEAQRFGNQADNSASSV